MTGPDVPVPDDGHQADRAEHLPLAEELRRRDHVIRELEREAQQDRARAQHTPHPEEHHHA